jgi:hypothetical protein
MPTIYRIVHPNRDVNDVGSVEAIDGVVQGGKPARYHIDQISSEPLPSGHTSRRWGHGASHRTRLRGAVNACR